MIKLPEGVTVHVNGQAFTGEIPDDLCPTEFLPAVMAPRRDTKPT